MLAALIGYLAELAGYDPVFGVTGESVPDSIDRLGPRIVLLDVDVALTGADAIFDRAAECHSRVVLFTGARGRAGAEALAAIHGAEVVELPVNPRSLATLLAGVLSALVLLMGR